MSAPRRPENVQVVRSAVKFLRHHEEADNGLGEVADMLEDIARGRWSLVPEWEGCRCQNARGPVCPGCSNGRDGQVRAVTPQGPRPGSRVMCRHDSEQRCHSPAYCFEHGCQL